MSHPLPALVAKIAAGSGEEAEFARRWSLLLVYQDIGGTLAVNSAGEVYSLPHDSAGPPQLETDSRWRSVALSQAASRFEELAFLRPARPSSASVCSACSGVGRAPGGQFGILCGTCMGLGWRAV